MRLSPSFLDRAKETGVNVFETIDKHRVEEFVRYFIDSGYRKAVNLKGWVKKQVTNPTEAVLRFADTIPTVNDPDKQIIACLKAVHDTLKYYGDKTTWDLLERWNTADETLTRWYVMTGFNTVRLVGTGTTPPINYAAPFRAGDCEDGAILLYVVARLKGISEEQLFLFAGDVENPDGIDLVGHCWLGYRNLSTPFGFYFIDWTYYYNTSSIENRPVFSVIDKHIVGWKQRSSNIIGEYKQYKKIWFLFNEKKSYLRINYKN